MHKLNSNSLTQFCSYIASQYQEYIKESRDFRCKIVEIGVDETTKEILLWVLISGIKKQLISYFPRELVNNDKMLCEFSPLDARAITFYAFQQEKYINSIPPKYIISGQEMQKSETIFWYTEMNQEGIKKIKAKDLYKNTMHLCGFNQIDLINIVSTAIQEQTKQDFL